MSKLHKGFQVRQHQPLKIWLGVAVLLTLMLVFFKIGEKYQAMQLDLLQLERETLKSRIAELETRNQNLLQKNAQLCGISKIEREAYEQANQNLVKMEQELLAQKEELIFYRGIVSPNDSELAVNLQSFEMRKKNNSNQYSYKMILTKNGKSPKKLQGSTTIAIRGESDGNVSELVLTDLALESQAANTNFAFRYFQVFEGDVTLPDGFEPFEVEIAINVTTKKVKSFSETISWASIMSEGV